MQNTNTNLVGRMEKKRIVVDTTAVISYFSHVFEKGSQIEKEGISIINDAFTSDDKIIMIIPSIVFVEIFDKWFLERNEEFRDKFMAEVFLPIQNSNNIEIREIDDEVIEEFIKLYDKDIALEQHDKIVLASAIVLKADLITSDKKLISFNHKHKKLISIIK